MASKKDNGEDEDKKGLEKALRDLMFDSPGTQNQLDSLFYQPRRSGRLRNCVVPLKQKSEALYDNDGKIDGVDLCDCLNLSCSGCFLICEKCGSLKCAQECRVGRKWTFGMSTTDGTNIVVKNPVLK